MGKVNLELRDKAVDAVKHVIHSLSESDFVIEAGTAAVDRLKVYSGEIAMDIYDKFADEPVERWIVGNHALFRIDFYAE